MNDLDFLREALLEAASGYAEGGIPIGSVIVIDGRIVGRGRNRRVQDGSVIRHAEMDCLENAGRLGTQQYRRASLYTTLSPCDMCSGAILLYGIPRVIVGENQSFVGAEDFLRSRGVTVDVLQDGECVALMRNFIRMHSDLWDEDVGR